ncbi:hypothetical protein [Vibrio diabolicus]|uniref:hypothetical protein n=1 Tax=Vibrio diabolicus TaxID=50719 RepID=UPI000F50A1CB|nr:hypothetical protein [Vibrio diabolicus]
MYNKAFKSDSQRLAVSLRSSIAKRRSHLNAALGDKENVMYLNREESFEMLLEKLDSLEVDFNDDITELFNILDDKSDWAFMIKATAYIELVLTNAITKQLSEDTMLAVVKHLPLINKNTGKVAIARNLGLLDKTHVSFIQEVASIRNEYAHNFEYVAMTLSDYFKKLEPNKANSKYRSMCIDNTGEPYRHLLESRPQLAIILGILFISMRVKSALMTSEVKSELDRLEMKTLRDLVGKIA